MKKLFSILLTAAIVVGCQIAYLKLTPQESYGVESIPGSPEDPVVTKSYVDKQIAELMASLEESAGDNSGYHSSESAAESAGSEGFKVVEVAADQKLLGGEGTEIILRSGTATVMASENGGVADLTAGADLKEGAAVVKNHLMLVPREDGRGIHCSSMCYVMVKGQYSLQ